VLPTGGGKSLCYQAPAVLRGSGSTTVVVSPLIALMKDQVDGLRANGIAAAQIDSLQTLDQRSAAERELRQGRIRLLFVSPERLVLTDFYRLLQHIGVRTFAIDEAHCISHWGHDFRPEYRQLARLREFFPEASVHAYTATATEQVRRDIIAQLALREPVVLVGNFDRPNLTYRVLPRHDVVKQVCEVLDRHENEAGIVYCMRRRDVDDLNAALRKRGIQSLPYHAGLTPEQRQSTQEAFATEQCHVVVATIAFGMGIDRSDVRFVIHTALPKSLEHYQQETGRAGRDGLAAECVLLYSGADLLLLKSMLEKSAQEPGADPSFLPTSLKHLADMDRYARGAVCRHKALVQYFGQNHSEPNCGACDLCLGDTVEVEDARVVAQKILSCVARVKEGFGIGQIVAILRGHNIESVRRRGHDKLTTFGLLRDTTDANVRDWVYQLIGQEVLDQVGDEYPILKLNSASWEVMRGQRDVRLVQLVRRKKGEKPRKGPAEESREGVDEVLYEALRQIRRRLAQERQVSAFIIFGERTLLDMARVRPATLEGLRGLYGISEAKLRDFGGQFHEVILDHCRRRGLTTDNHPGGVSLFRGPADPDSFDEAADQPAPITLRKESHFALFRSGASLDEVAQQQGVKRNTAVGHLEDWIRAEKPDSIETWVARAVYDRVAEAARQVGASRLKPIYLLLGERVSYDDIRLVVAHLQSQCE
jgi:ATP-dependent DNA helicase RecQ